MRKGSGGKVGRPIIYGPEGRFSKAYLSTWIPQPLSNALHAACVESGLSITSWIQRAIHEKIMRDYQHLLDQQDE